MKSGKPRVAILTSLVDYSPAYSLVGIILDQARALKEHGYDYDLLCLKNFNRKEYEAPDLDKELSIKYILPQTRLVDYAPNQKAEDDHIGKNGEEVLGFESQAMVHFEGNKEKGWIGYKDALKDYDVIISHDLMFLSWHLPQNKALRMAIDLYPEKNWLHWVHSGPSVPPDDMCYPSELRFSTAPHSTYVYLNETQRLDYSLMIRAPKSLVRTVYNPKDIRDVWRFGEDTCEFISRYDLFDHKILMIYPFSTPRWRDKGIRQLFKIFSFWKQLKIRARLVLVNAHCNSPVDVPRLEAIEAYAKLCELNLDDDVILTSRFGDETGRKIWRYTVPFQTVRELVLMSNMFIFPSVSECCSLIQAEASIAGGKFMVLNRDFPPMLEFCSSNVLHYEFTNNDPDRNPDYYECVAREIWANFNAESAVVNATQARTRTYNRDWIFRNQLEPLLYLNFSKKKIMEGQKQRSVLRPEFKGKQPPVAVELESPSGEKVIAMAEQIKKEKMAPTADTVNPKTGQLEPVKMEELNYEDPVDGMSCGIFGTCSSDQKADCFKEAGHCLMLDEEVPKGKVKVQEED